MTVINSKEEFYEQIKKEKILVDFYADWCGPCKILSQILEEIENKLNIPIIKVNTDAFMSIAREYKIQSIPALKIFSNGKVIKEKVGLMSKEELEDFVNN